MSEHLILATSYGRALADPAVPCVITQWYGFANAQQFIALQEAALAYFEQHSSPTKPWGWVGDVRRMGAVPEEAQRWLQQQFNTRARAAGLRRVCVVVAESIFGKIATQHYAQQTQASNDSAAPIAMAYHPTLEEAKVAAGQALR